MGAYRTTVGGTDGSVSSLRAVARAGAVVGPSGASLVVVCAADAIRRSQVDVLVVHTTG